MELMLALVLVVLLTIGLLYLGQKFNVPSVVLFLIVGMLVGPYTLGIF